MRVFVTLLLVLFHISVCLRPCKANEQLRVKICGDVTAMTKISGLQKKGFREGGSVRVPIQGVYLGLPVNVHLNKLRQQPGGEWVEDIRVPRDLPRVKLSLKTDITKQRTILVYPRQEILDPRWSGQAVKRSWPRFWLDFGSSFQPSPSPKGIYVFSDVPSSVALLVRDPAELLFTTRVLVSNNTAGGLTDHRGLVTLDALPDGLALELIVQAPGFSRSEFKISSESFTFDKRWRFKVAPNVNFEADHVIVIESRESEK